MACTGLTEQPGYGVGGTFADGIGRGACGDAAETAAMAAAAALGLAAVVVTARTDQKGKWFLAAAAAATVALLAASLMRYFYGAPVLIEHRSASAAQSRQIGVPVQTAIFASLYSLGLGNGETPGGCLDRLRSCAMKAVLDLINGAYTSAAVIIAVAHPMSASATAYVAFDLAGIGLAVVWAAALAVAHLAFPP